MSIEERIPALSDKDLATLQDNALRLQQTGVAKQKNEAERILPLIEAELAERRARKPAPVRKAAAPRKAPAPRKTAVRSKEKA